MLGLSQSTKPLHVASLGLIVPLCCGGRQIIPLQALAVQVYPASRVASSQLCWHIQPERWCWLSPVHFIQHHAWPFRIARTWNVPNSLLFLCSPLASSLPLPPPNIWGEGGGGFCEWEVPACSDKCQGVGLRTLRCVASPCKVVLIATHSELMTSRSVV